jgi:hypothetical protein
MIQAISRGWLFGISQYVNLALLACAANCSMTPRINLSGVYFSVGNEKSSGLSDVEHSANNLPNAFMSRSE